jgi:hypothetical protein
MHLQPLSSLKTGLMLTRMSKISGHGRLSALTEYKLKKHGTSNSCRTADVQRYLMSCTLLYKMHVDVWTFTGGPWLFWQVIGGQNPPYVPSTVSIRVADEKVLRH